MLEAERVTLGRICGLFGVRGWVKVFSYTDPRENIVNYSPWLVRLGGEWRSFRVLEGRRQGKNVIARLEGIDDRDQAMPLLHAEVAIERAGLPELAAGEYYWADLQGLEVVTVGGLILGRVDQLLETGANDVLVVQGERERLIPWVRGEVVRKVDTAAGRIEVDWDPEF
ncbi:MAG: ribosome maturation factor RimM [Gammaproteobacteria bacterium]|jgi:16S rRNA processing protein RimM